MATKNTYTPPPITIKDPQPRSSVPHCFSLFQNVWMNLVPYSKHIYIRTLKNINRFENLEGIVTSPFSETTGTVSLNTAGRYWMPQLLVQDLPKIPRIAHPKSWHEKWNCSFRAQFEKAKKTANISLGCSPIIVDWRLLDGGIFLGFYVFFFFSGFGGFWSFVGFLWLPVVDQK